MATILIIDDSEPHRKEIRSAISEARAVDRILEAEDGLAGLRLLLQESVDLVLCDLHMPGLEGDKLVRMKTPGDGWEDVPFVFLTANPDPRRKARLLREGATDIIGKPFHPEDLLARVELHLKVARLQRELRHKNALLARLSTTDDVTGLRNRRYLTEFLAVEFLRARRYRTPLALLLCDLDRFKLVNDVHGHAAGDAVLRLVAALLASERRAMDLVARYGGEEFVIVLPHTDAQGARQLAEQLRLRVEAMRVEIASGEMVGVTLSVGVAGFREAHTSPEDLIAEADTALYRAKEGGRNRVEVAAGEGAD